MQNIPDWLNNAIFYEIYPQSFFDSNGDGIGDLRGIISKLDYIAGLGVNAIWVNPCFDSPFQDAGYDISDFYKVAPRYGSNQDLVNLFDQAHTRGIKVILDLVAGHTSIEHPWFKKSSQSTPNQFSNYYIWSQHWLDEGKGYRFINGLAERNANFMINFFYCQPALNYGFCPPDPQYPWQLPCDHPDVKVVREELRSIMKFWLDHGADGFRVDMASSLIRGENAAEGIHELWQDYRTWLDQNYPDAVLVSEWLHPAKSIAAGFHVDFLLHCKLPGYTSLFRNEAYRVPNSPFAGGYSYFDSSGQGDVTLFVDELREQLQATENMGYIAMPSGNHDLGRISQGRTQQELKVVHTFLLTLPGIPFIYYGDEIGMEYLEGLSSKEGGYNRTGSRTPMQWDRSVNAGFSTAPSKKLYLPLNSNHTCQCVAEQENDSDSLLHLVRRLIALRKAHPALATKGDFIILFAEKNRYPLVYERRQGEQRFVIAINPSNNPAFAEFGCANAQHAVAVENTGCQMDVVLGQVRLSMPPISCVIYSIVVSGAKIS